jgi:hypothetical protein
MRPGLSRVRVLRERLEGACRPSFKGEKARGEGIGFEVSRVSRMCSGGFGFSLIIFPLLFFLLFFFFFLSLIPYFLIILCRVTKMWGEMEGFLCRVGHI